MCFALLLVTIVCIPLTVSQMYHIYILYIMYHVFCFTFSYHSMYSSDSLTDDIYSMGVWRFYVSNIRLYARYVSLSNYFKLSFLTMLHIWDAVIQFHEHKQSKMRRFGPIKLVNTDTFYWSAYTNPGKSSFYWSAYTNPGKSYFYWSAYTNPGKLSFYWSAYTNPGKSSFYWSAYTNPGKSVWSFP